jgi:hypothetical protein
LFPDQNAEDSAKPDDPISQIQYGRLAYILVLEMDAFPQAGEPFLQASTHRLACILPCKLLNNEDATETIVEFNQMEQTPIFVHVGVVECSVGRVKTPTGWSIIDRSNNFARTVFNPDA